MARDLRRPDVRALLVGGDAADRTALERRLREATSAASQVDHETEAVDGVDRIGRRQHDLYFVVHDTRPISGLEVLRRALEAAGDTRPPQIIMLGRLAEADRDAAAVTVGAVDVLPRDGLNAELLRRSLRYSRVLASKDRQLEAVRSKLDGEAKTLEPMMWATTELFTKDLERMERDLNDARAMQTELLPPGPPATAGIEWFWTFDPCEEVGGDLYDYSWLDERRLALYVIDVSGHGLPAALYSSALTRVVKALASRSAAAGPAAFVQELSREFPMSQTTGQYFTIQYGILDIESRTFVVTSAGHPGPAWISAAGGGEVFAIPGPPAGIPELDEFEEIEIKLAVGDRVLMYSDGLVEALNPRQEEFGAERLLRAFGDQGGLEAAITRLQEEVQQWTAPGKPADDRSAFGFQVVGP